jgi:hypothetical protein
MPIVSAPLRRFMLAGILLLSAIPAAPAGAGRAFALQQATRTQRAPAAAAAQPCEQTLRHPGKTLVGPVDDSTWAEVPAAWAQRSGRRIAVSLADTDRCHPLPSLRRQYRGWREQDGQERNYHWFFPLGPVHAVASGDPAAGAADGSIRTTLAAQESWFVSSPAKQALRN